VRHFKLVSLPLAALLVALLVPGCGQPDADEPNQAAGLPKTLRVGLVPNIAPEQQKAKYQPFADYLSKRLDVTVELFVAADYAGVVAALAGDRIDVAYLGGLTYVQAEQQAKLTPLVTEIDQETGTARYFSAIVVRNDSSARTVRDDVVKSGRTFAFGDISSTSGSLYPRMMLTDAGARCSTRKMDDCPPLDRVVFTGGHDATAQTVLGGKADAGGIELRILHRLEREGKVPAGALRVVEQREVHGYPWVMRTALGDTARSALVQAFTELTDRSLLDLLRAQGYTEVSAADYDEIRRQATRLGLLAAA
jgi:phosphonate transport system substrate-binding protein